MARVVPSEIFLRAKDGAAIGPLPMRALEVLYYARIVDENTPISPDGADFKPMKARDAVVKHVQNIKQMLVDGQDPWPDSTDDLSAAPIVGDVPVDETSPLKVMFTTAVSKATGKLTFKADAGEVTLTYGDGKVLEVATTVPDLALEKYLVAKGVCDKNAISQAEKRAAQMGGIGGALISMGLVPPNVFIEKFVEWAKATVGAVIGWTEGTSSFASEPAASPAVPLGLDRFGVLIEAVRVGFDKDRADKLLDPKKPNLIIPSSLEGASVDDLKLDPRELRVVRAVDGIKTLGEVLEAHKGKGDQAIPALRAIYFALELGLLVLGDDPLTPKEREEAKRVNEIYARMKSKNHFEVLGVKSDADDETVRARYKEFAKKYHPDTLRPGAAPELIEARKKVFDQVNASYDAIETADKRKTYKTLVDQGFASARDEREVVQKMLEAEMHFRKAEALAKSRRYDDAVRAVDEAIKLKPKDNELKLYKVFYTFLGKSDGQKEAAAQAIKDILPILKAEPNIAAGYLFLGRLHKVIDKQDLAIRYFKKVLEFDDKNAEAQSEIRLATMRQDKNKKKSWL